MNIVKIKEAVSRLAESPSAFLESFGNGNGQLQRFALSKIPLYYSKHQQAVTVSST